MQEWIVRVEDLCTKHSVDHRFVGGTVTELLGSCNEPTIDIRNKSVRLNGACVGGVLRSDGTTKDLDMVAFGADEKAIVELKKELKSFSGKKGAPYVSMEEANYASWGWPRQTWRQFVNAFDVDGKGDLSLRFRNLCRPIPWESVEPWKLEVNGDFTLTTLNPYAQALCYAVRAPSGVKLKYKRIEVDGEGKKHSKIWRAMKSGCLVKKLDERPYIDGLYKEWLEFVRQLKSTTDPEIRFAAWVTGMFWKYGEDINHGRGPLKLISQLSDKVNG